MNFPGKWWKPVGDGRFQCDLCPRECRLKPGQRGFCFVRMATEEGIVLTTYGRSSGFCVDPIEKKPLNHFYPGTPVLSFGTAGCNLACKFCQNWDISKAKKFDRLQEVASPEMIADAALRANCRSVAFTYNDPVIFAEYAIDTAIECRKKGVKSVAVSAGYMGEKAREEFYAVIDAANIDLKGFTEKFYKKLTYSALAPVLETLEYLKNETDVWFEVTTLLIPGENDSEKEIEEQTQWMMEKLGSDVPLHFSAFHPDYKMLKHENTPQDTLTRSRNIALKNGLRFVYTGNVHDPVGSSTYCPKCKELLIERDWYVLGEYGIKDGACGSCGEKIVGHFENQPGQWGAKRQRITV